MQTYDVRTVTSNDLSIRSYVTFYFNNKRIREYNGNSINIKLQPNSAKTIKERNRLLRRLEFELKTALENGNYPSLSTVKINTELQESSVFNNVQFLMDKAIELKANSNLSHFYLKNLKSVHRQFTSFLTKKELSGNIEEIKRTRIEEFLQQFSSSGTYYMDRRRDLGVLFSTISREIDKPLLVVKETKTMKRKATLHKIYDREQLIKTLDYLKVYHTNLHICCLICYGCFLRPHQEVRNLKGRHFMKNCTEIHLSGDENKSGRVRTVHIPNYVREVILERVSLLGDDDNLFTMNKTPFNIAYFNTQWKRVRDKMFNLGIIDLNQTIYSFRHTAAVNVFHKTKDVSLVQRLLGHSDMIVTLTYLRGLGELNNDDLKNSLPELY